MSSGKILTCATREGMASALSERLGRAIACITSTALNNTLVIPRAGISTAELAVIAINSPRVKFFISTTSEDSTVQYH